MREETSSKKIELFNSHQITIKRIQKYVFSYRDELGHGNFSKVYKAIHDERKELYAIKIIELARINSDKLTQLWQNELALLKQLDHPNVLKCHEIFMSQKHCYIVTQLCNQGDLSCKLRTKKRLIEAEIIKYIREIANGLSYLNQQGIVHRDIKASNILVHNGCAKIADFGFAKVEREKFKDSNIGTPLYMPPEALINNIYGPKTDVWAFGMLIYQLLHGETPFSYCQSEESLRQNICIPVTRSQIKAEMSSQLKELIMKCLEIDETRRISVKEILGLEIIKGKQPKQRVSTQNSSSDKFEGANKYKFAALKNRIVLSKQLIILKDNGDGATGELSTARNSTLSSQYIEHPLPKLASPQKRRTKNSLGQFSARIERNRGNKSSYDLQSKDHTFQNRFYKLNKAISTSLDFIESQCLVLYCKLIASTINLMREIRFCDVNQIKIFENWLLLVLRELRTEIHEGRVIFNLKEYHKSQYEIVESMSEVIVQTAAKLNLVLAHTSSEEPFLSFQKIITFLKSIEELITKMIHINSNSSILLMGNYLVRLSYYTKIASTCFSSRSYCKIYELKQIQQFLAARRENLTLLTYLQYKKKLDS